MLSTGGGVRNWVKTFFHFQAKGVAQRFIDMAFLGISLR
jgi:hypothetical protein